MANEMHIGALERTYAAALLELAKEAGQLDAVGQEVAELGQLLGNNPQALELLASRILGEGERQVLTQRVFAGRVSDLVLRFLHIVERKGRMALLPAICGAFAVLLQMEHGQIEVTAIVPAEMEQSHALQLATKLSVALGRKVILQQQIDASLIGGLRLRVGDQLIDGSVATQLRLLKEKMIESGRQQARTDLNKVLVES